MLKLCSLKIKFDCLLSCELKPKLNSKILMHEFETSPRIQIKNQNNSHGVLRKNIAYCDCVF